MRIFLLGLIMAFAPVATGVVSSESPIATATKTVVEKKVSSQVVAGNFELPVQKIEGAEKSVDLGDVVMLNLSKIDKVPTGFVSYTVDWKVFDKGVEKKFFKTSDGSGIFFGSGIEKRKLIVFAAVSYLYVTKDGDKLVEAAVKSQFLTVVVDIGGGVPGPGPGPDPNPGPGPGPDPEPVFPDGTYKLAAKSYKWAKDNVLIERAAAAAELSKSFSAMAAKIAAGQELNTAEDIKRVLQETVTENRKALAKVGVAAVVWEEFFVALQHEIYGMYTSGTLLKKNDFATAWREISNGLSKVK